MVESSATAVPAKQDPAGISPLEREETGEQREPAEKTLGVKLVEDHEGVTPEKGSTQAAGISGGYSKNRLVTVINMVTWFVATLERIVTV